MSNSKCQSFVNFQINGNHSAVKYLYLDNIQRKHCDFKLKEIKNNEKIGYFIDIKKIGG